MDNEEIKKAKEVLGTISQDERERRLTELREKYIMDQHAIHDHGFDKGLEAGIEQGIEKGILQVASKMKSKGISIEEIVEMTGLTKEEIDKI